MTISGLVYNADLQLPEVAVIVVVPAVSAVARPLLSMDATLVSDEVN